MKSTSNIVLIGMPGAGKSTVGVVLAKYTQRHFVDTDVLIQLAEGRTLQEIVDADGYLELRAIEERLLLGLKLRNHVIATGGSAAYSARAMEHLKRDGLTVFLHVTQQELVQRVKDYGTRGLARRPDQTFDDLFRERYVLYVRHADVTIDCRGKTQEQIAEEIRTWDKGGGGARAVSPAEEVQR